MDGQNDEIGEPTIKHKSIGENLIRAGALIAAEIDRLLRAEKAQTV